MARNIARSYVLITAANFAVLAVTAASYILYSRYLTPAQFAIFGTALAGSRICVSLLDGGVRNVFIADTAPADPGRYTATSVVLFVLSLILIVAGFAVARLLERLVPNIGFVLAYIVPFLLSYPLFFSSLVQLEKRLDYGGVAIVETGSAMIELGLPAMLIIGFGMGLPAFILAACISRAARTLAFWLFAKPLWGRFGREKLYAALVAIRTSLLFQYTIGMAALRDNLPILLVAPLYGARWAGYYVWALQISAVSSQFAVAAASRIALPVLSSHESDDARYRVTAVQMAWMARLLGPVLVAVWLIAPALDTLLFHQRWAPALAILPWLLLRMLPGIAPTLLYPLTFVQLGPKRLAMIATGWTLAEVTGGWIMLHGIGPIGLAYSYAFAVWLGIALMIWHCRDRPDFTLPGLFRALFLNWPTMTAFVLGMMIFLGTQALPVRTLIEGAALAVLIGAMLAIAYLSDPKLRERLLALVPRRRPVPAAGDPADALAARDR